MLADRPSLRFLRSFLDAAEGRESGDFGLEAELIAEFLPLALAAAGQFREHAEDDLVELGGRAHQSTPLDGAAGHLHEGPASGHETQFAAHAPYQS